jgi:Zn-dependent protease with chaperone function
MAFDFFQAQEQARRNSKLLVLLFVVAVCCLVLLTNLVLLLTLGLFNSEHGQLIFVLTEPHAWPTLPWPAIGFCSLAVVLVIGIVVELKRAELRQGGQVIAKALGGARLDHHIADGKARMLLNVVEEMAIAAGIPVPPVYLLPERGINAFAAGYAPADAVIGITEGCLLHLNRDQLQGVIAHEISHILNGDMRMNIRLIALLHGILFIGQAGYQLLQHDHLASSAMGSVNSRSRGENRFFLLILALALIILGYLGSFFGHLIKAAVSRQREFLADASAVQFTRNPSGIAGALKVIGAMGAGGSHIQHPNADAMSHLFFGEAMSRWFSVFATHPPLEKRIKRIEPAWLGQYPTLTVPADNYTMTTPSRHVTDNTSVAPQAAKVAAFAQASAPFITTSMPARQDSAPLHTEVARSAADVPPFATEMGIPAGDSSPILATLPTMLLHRSRHAASAPALVCACLVQHDHLARQLHLIKELGSAALLAEVDRMLDQISQLSARQKLHLMQLAIPALKQQTTQQFRYLHQLIESLIDSDGHHDLLEWSLLCWLDHCVAAHFDKSHVYSGASASRLHQVQDAALCLLSVCSQQNQEPALQQQAWLAGLALLELPDTTIQPTADLAKLRTLLPTLLQTTPTLKKQLWRAIQASVYADLKVNDEEALLLAALALLLELPTPSLL